ncbi:unnamed protein product [Sphagnum compactum]
MWTVKDLFYGPEAAITHQYAYPNPVEEVAKENMPTHERKGDVQLKVAICCEACVKKVRRVLIETAGVNAVYVDTTTRKVTVTGDVKPDACLKAIGKINKRATLWSEDAKKKKK